ncbi:MAG: DUF559 domain-containing protein [Alphaproteobacteria bacterium]|nr:DUF559 domain-containing protein [Alphaproteobacteria bacterium]
MGKIHDRPALRDRRRELRRDAPRAERLLWGALRGRRDDGLRFRRQHGVGPYVVDFYCAHARLAVELNGAAHDGEAEQRRDVARDAFNARCGIRVVRIRNEDAFDDLVGVVAGIVAAAGE